MDGFEFENCGNAMLKYARNVINNYGYSLAEDYSDLCDI